MKKTATLFLFGVGIMYMMAACGDTANKPNETAKTYKPEEKTLYESIVLMDSIFFEAYNTCNLDKQATIYSDSIEFYHDKGGLMTSKQSILDATKKNVCGKVTRELIAGSIEVYPIKGFGAVEMGEHRFHNNTEKKDAPSSIGRFTILWQNVNNEWKIKRVISLH